MAKQQVTRRKKRSESMDPRILALGAGAVGAVAGGAIARSRVKKVRTTAADRVRMAKQAIRSVPNYRSDMQDLADAKNRVRTGKADLASADKAGMSYLKSQRFTQGSSSTPGLAEREIINRTKSAKNSIETGTYNEGIAGAKMEKNRAAVSSLMNSASSAKYRADKAAYKSKANRATRSGAIKGAASAATVAMIVSAVLKELNKK